MPLDGWSVRPVDDEVMAFWLAGDGIVDGLVQKVIALGGPHRSPEVGGILLAEAHEKPPRAGEPHPIAALAEIMRHGGDEADLAPGFLDADVAGGPTGPLRQIGEVIRTLQPLADHRQRQELVDAGWLDLAEGHDLDEGKVHAAAMRPGQQGL